MVVIAVTGATGDVGYALCTMLAASPEVTKLVVTCRTKETCTKVIARLTADTGKPTSTFSSVVIEFDKYDSVLAAVSEFPTVDRICLNAGGLGECTIHAPSGATDCVGSNVLGHSLLTDKLLAAGKINPGGQIIYVGSEVTRTIWSFKGLLPDYMCFSEKDIDWALTRTYNADCGPVQPYCCPPIRQQLGDYKNAKIIGHLFYAAVAEERPDIHTMIVSPGGVGGSFGNGAYFPMGCLLANCAGMFRMMCVMHTMDEGVQRIFDAAMTRKYEAGSHMMSPPNCGCCLWGVMGTPPVDNRKFASYLSDESLHAPAAAKVRALQERWATGIAPSPASMH